MGKLTEAKALAEEAYMFVSEVYDPEHPLVLEAGDQLVQILGHTGDYHDAERFARICYEGLTRAPLDPESVEAAKGAATLAQATCNLISKNGPESADIEEAEMLARKAIRIMKERKGPASNELGYVFESLVRVRLLKEDFTGETKSLLEDYLSDAIRYETKDGENASLANRHLGQFHSLIVDTLPCNEAKRKHLQLSESYYKESVRLQTEQFGRQNCNTLKTAARLSEVTRKLEQIRSHH
jgi:hypothetical protein